MKLKGHIHSVETFGTLDGPGIRYVLFFQGCRLNCLYCHNPDTRMLGGGRLMSVAEVMAEIQSYRAFIRNGGVTLSGGEPLLQPEFALAVVEACRTMGVHTALDTAGAVPLELSRRVIDATDLILLDIKSIDPQICQELTGDTHWNTLATLEYCEEHHKPVWVRHVLVPGYTLDERQLNDLADYVMRFTCVTKVELLPYHKLGEYKWEQLGLPYALAGVEPPSEEQVNRAKDIFRRRGLI